MTSHALTKLEQEQNALIAIKRELAHEPRLQKLQSALGKTIAAGTFVNIALTAMRSNSKVLACTIPSIVDCCMEAAYYGVQIGGPRPEAVLVPRKINGVMTCTLQLQYQAYKRLARNHPSVAMVDMDCIRKGDQYEFISAVKPLKIIPSGSKTRMTDPVEHAYCTVYFQDGSQLTRIWTVEECKAHRDRYSDTWKYYNRSKDHDPRDTMWHEENPSFWIMCAKTVMLHMVARGDIPIQFEDLKSQLVKELGEGPTILPPTGVLTDQTNHPDGVGEPPSNDGESAAQPSAPPSDFEFTGVMCKNLQAALTAADSLADISVIREKLESKQWADDEREWIDFACRKREEEIREAKSKTANGD